MAFNASPLQLVVAAAASSLAVQFISRNSDTLMRPSTMRASRCIRASILFQNALRRSKSAAIAVPISRMNRSATSSASFSLLFLFGAYILSLFVLGFSEEEKLLFQALKQKAEISDT